MEIDYWREFVVLAETGNFLEAADTLYIAQSTLSKHIKKIESELGVPLFDRTTRQVRISKYGQLLLPYAQQIAEIQDQYTTALQNSLAVDRERLTLGSIPALAQYKITDLVVDYKQAYPQSTLDVVQAGSEELREMLRQQKCELAFIRDTDEQIDDDLVRIPYAVDTMVAVLPATHPSTLVTSRPGVASARSASGESSSREATICSRSSRNRRTGAMDSQNDTGRLSMWMLSFSYL
jgi:LysR family transcriptional activator of glutamate synthase operon